MAVMHLQESMTAHRNGTGRATIKATTLRFGVKLPYVEQGDPSGLPVVLVHGYSDSWRSWETVLPHLPPSLHVFAPTQRGHGDADRPASGYRVTDFANDLAAFIDMIGLPQCLIVGHSLGSYVAQRYAMDHPERVLGLVLAGSVTTWRENPVVAGFWEEAVSTLEDPIDPAFVREFQESPRLSAARLEAVVQESLKVPARIWKETLRGILEADFSADLNIIAVPTLIVWGDQDALCPREEQDALAAAIPGSHLMVHPGGGHNFHWEDPERFAADLIAFCERLAG